MRFYLFVRQVILIFFLFLSLAACARDQETIVPMTRPPAEATIMSAAATAPTDTAEVASLPATPSPIPSVTPAATLPTDPSVIAPENAAGLTQVAHFGKGRIDSIAFTPDGSSLIAAGGYEAHTWDVHSGQLLQTQASDIPIWSIALSPDGSLMAWGGGERQYISGNEQQYIVQMWDVATGQPLYTLQEQDGVVFKVLFSPDGQLLATWNDDNTLVKLRQASTGELLFSQPAWNVVFHPNGRLFAVDGAGDILGVGDVGLQLWDMDTFELAGSVEGLQNPFTFTADGNIVASNHTDIIALWHTDTGDLLLPFTEGDVGAGYDPKFAALSPDGRILALRNQFRTLELWDMSSGQLLWASASAYVTSAAFSPDGRLLATGNQDGTLSLWGLEPYVEIVVP
jgi:WD40 repeat protein